LTVAVARARCPPLPWAGALEWSPLPTIAEVQLCWRYAELARDHRRGSSTLRRATSFV